MVNLITKSYVDSVGETHTESSGLIRVVSQSYLHAIAEGDIEGHTVYAKLGCNGDVGAMAAL